MRRDLENYLTQVQKQYTELQKTLETVNKQISEGMITQEQAAPIMDYYNKVASNYERIMYCRYLYNLPPKFIQKLQQKKIQKEAQKYIDEHADKDSIVAENQEALDAIKEVVVEEEKE